MNKQLASSVLMIRPHQFFSNPLTAQSNKFQGKSSLSGEQLHACALKEFDALVANLREVGVDVILFDDTPEPPTPDSVFPNNWVSFHTNGTVVLYPMEAKNRRTERREDIISSLKDNYGFSVQQIVDLTHHESQERYLEGTGSMVLDHANKIAYACLSSRTNINVLHDFARKMDYSVTAFDAVDRLGSPIYHTNVMMSVGESLAIICDDSIQPKSQREKVLSSLNKTNHKILKITFEQMEAFAGNVLEVLSDTGEHLLLMSNQAMNSFSRQQIKLINAYARIIAVSINNIENSAGGGVRCMMAEINLPKKKR